MRISQTVRHVALLGLQIIIVGALLGFVLAFSERYNRRFDLSPTQQFVLSEASRKVAASLPEAAQITAFYNSQEQGQRRDMLDVLDLFAKASERISYRLVDLDRSPALAQKYGVSNANSGVIEYTGKTAPLRYLDEEEISNAILKLTQRATRRLCFVSGHGEHTPYDANERSGYSAVGKALEHENFEIERLDGVPPPGVPPTCDVVIIAGPTRDFLPGETEALAHYLSNGGQMLFLVDPGAPAGAIEFLRTYGVQAAPDVVLDERNRLLGTDSAMLNVPVFNKEIFRSELDAAVFPVARPILPLEEADRAGQVTILALSSPDSWAYANGGKLPDGDVRFRRDVDHPGPLPVGAIATVRTPEGSAAKRPGRILIFGDSDFATNLSLNWRGNKDVFMSSIAVLAEDPTLVAIRRKGQPHGSMSPIYLTESQDTVVFWSSVVIAPLCCACVGVAFTARRRRRCGR